MNRKQAYEEKIQPLLMQIRDVCNEYQIMNLMTFDISDKAAQDEQIAKAKANEGGDIEHHLVTSGTINSDWGSVSDSLHAASAIVTGTGKAIQVDKDQILGGLGKILAAMQEAENKGEQS